MLFLTLLVHFIGRLRYVIRVAVWLDCERLLTAYILRLKISSMVLLLFSSFFQLIVSVLLVVVYRTLLG